MYVWAHKLNILNKLSFFLPKRMHSYNMHKVTLDQCPNNTSFRHFTIGLIHPAILYPKQHVYWQEKLSFWLTENISWAGRRKTVCSHRRICVVKIILQYIYVSNHYTLDLHHLIGQLYDKSWKKCFLNGCHLTIKQAKTVIDEIWRRKSRLQNDTLRTKSKFHQKVT